MALDTDHALAALTRDVDHVVQAGGAGAAARADMATLSRLLLASAGWDAVHGYGPETLAAFVEVAYDFIATKPRKGPSIRVKAAELPAGSATQRIATIQILNDDMPFLVDSIVAEVQAQGLSPRLVVHPIFKTDRDADGRLRAVTGPGDRDWGDGRQESYIAVVLDPIEEKRAEALAHALPSILEDVRVVVDDWKPMLARLDSAITDNSRAFGDDLPEDLREPVEFCRWLSAGNFTFLGCRELVVVGRGDDAALHVDGDSGLGLIRDAGRRILFRPQGAELPQAPVVVAKSPLVSRVHRRVGMDYIGVGVYDRQGRAVRLLEILGLFASAAYTQSARQIPLIRAKIDAVVASSSFAQGSHSGKVLLNVLESFPRDELFQLDAAQLLEWGDAIVDLDLRPRTRVLARVDRYSRFAVFLIFVPRDRYGTTVREHIGGLLSATCGGQILSFKPYFTDGPLVRVHFVVALRPGSPPRIDAAEIEARIADAVRSWDDRLVEAITALSDEGPALMARYRDAFTLGYQEVFAPDRALEDIRRIERLGPATPVAIDFYRAHGQERHALHAAVYRFGAPIPLSERVPVLENMGFRVIDERTYRVMPNVDGVVSEVFLHDMLLERREAAPVDLDRHDERMEAAFLAVFAAQADNDGFNRLVMAAGLDWRQVALLRALAAYMRQIRLPFDPAYVAETLSRHPDVAADLVALFKERFDPDIGFDLSQRRGAETMIANKIDVTVGAVESLDEDRILRLLRALVGAVQRTSFYQHGQEDGAPATITLKFAPETLEAVPEPRPYREIFVYSPRVEGVHLRFAPIARGGIRWSDRAQDYRTEVLGLAKAQQVKNAVIVPHGAKGGFLPKALPRGGSREDMLAEGIAAYRIYCNALLDITDNIVEGTIVPPQRVVRHDGDDPYLVVAADKGTATFSDFANAISAAHGFWLGDAFASGGSAGYDHKGMGITARGAWECVKRHFREMDRDIQTEPFTVVGIGDMSGDVFGNGMLLSPATRLVAAFDHRDIFIDPEPDPVASLGERQRLFAMPRSSWQDYDRARISQGGGVFSRSAKAIALSPETRALLGIDARELPPNALIRAVLKLKADLLWFGGIGTYVRAPEETDADVGDRGNDAVRITADEVGACVIGEGANLGVTQRGRIAYARAGGRINTDFIDNSAGVNTSDQEVNIKIALAPAVASGILDEKARNARLSQMTQGVAAAALRNNYHQSLAISQAERRGADDLGYMERLLEFLEAKGLVDRVLETLPDAAEIRRREAAGEGLTRPEIAVVMSFAKIALTSELLASDVPDDARIQALLPRYFLLPVRDLIGADLAQHRLRREIITTTLTNSMINRGGPAFVVRLADETGREPREIAFSFMAARRSLALSGLWGELDALDGRIEGALQLSLYLRVQDALWAVSGWFARQDEHWARAEEVEAVARHLRGCDLEDILPPDQSARLLGEIADLEGRGVPAQVARDIVLLDVLARAPHISTLSRATGCGTGRAAQALFQSNALMRLEDIRRQSGAIPLADHFDRLALKDALATIAATAERMAAGLLADEACGGGAPSEALPEWIGRQHATFARAVSVVDELLARDGLTVSRLSVAAARVRDLTGH